MSQHPATLTEELFLREVEVEATRGSGPGGQHRNKTDTAIRVVHRPTGVQAQAGERRSKHMNYLRALERLRRKLALMYRRPLEEIAPEGTVEPSPLWTSRLKGTRVHVSPEHPDYSPLLAEALDVLAWCSDDVARAARLLHTSTAQLIRFLHLEPPALAALNERRARRGLKPLRHSSR